MPFFYAFTEHVAETSVASGAGTTTFVEITFDAGPLLRQGQEQ